MPAADRKNSDLRAEIVKDKFRSDTPPARATILSFLQPEKSDAFADALSEPRYTRLGHGTPVCYLLIFMPKYSLFTPKYSLKKYELRFCFGVRIFSLRHRSRRIAGLQIFFNRFINLRRAKFYAFFVQMNKVVVADNFFLHRINKPV